MANKRTGQDYLDYKKPAKKKKKNKLDGDELYVGEFDRIMAQIQAKKKANRKHPYIQLL